MADRREYMRAYRAAHPEYTKARRAKVRATRALARKAILDGLRQKPCADCGLVDPAVMEFDHVPERGGKFRSLGSMATGGSQRQFLAEIAKCDVVCANCHKRRTAARI